MSLKTVQDRWTALVDGYIPDDTQTSEARQYRIVATVVCIFILVASFFLPLCFWLGYYGTSTGHAAAIIVGFLALRTLRPFGPVVAAHLTAVACCATLIPYVTLAGGFAYPFFFWLLIVPLCAGLLGGQRTGAIWSVIISMIVTFYVALHTNGVRLPIREMNDAPAFFVHLQALSLVFMVSATMYVFQRNQTWEENQTRAAIERLEQEVKERRAAEEEARRANRAKSAFLAMMSHELRTPMNGVLGMAQLLLLEDQPASQRQHTEVLRDSGELLMGLLDSILDFSKIESGRLELEQRQFSLERVLFSASGLMRSRAEQKQLELTVNLSDDLPRLVIGDELRLRQMVLNLLSNAIKFTEFGHVRLTASQTPSGTVRIDIEDTGIGISEAAQAKLFHAFTQADSATTRKYGGTGLGLAIVSSLAEAMGGHVSVESHMGVGSLFSLEIPLKRAKTAPRDTSDTDVSPLGLRILLVEDNAVNQLVATKYLKALGCSALTASNGKEALERLATAEVDIVLMDMHMPVMDGLEATKRIRETHGLALPVLGFTASVTKRDRAACLASGMNDVLSKPLVLDTLRQVLERYVTRVS